MIENDDGTYSFHYARRVVQDDKLLGVVVVTVDLGLHEEGWRRAAGQGGRHRLRGPGAARLRAELAQADAAQPARRRPTRRGCGQALRDARDTFGAPAYVYLAGTPHLLVEVPVGFRNWRLTYFQTLEDVRARVNAVLSLIIMVLALLLALAFYLLSRRTRAESRRIQRESEELRVLNRRLSSEIAARKRVEMNLKEAEQSLEQASKLAALGQMSAAVSHELNQPLAAMKTYLAGARLLLTRRRPDEALSSFQRIDDLIDRMGGITRQLKSYARKGDVDIEPVDLRDSVRAALAMMAPQLGKMAVQIQTTLPSEPAIVHGRSAADRADHRQPAPERARRGPQPGRPPHRASCWSPARPSCCRSRTTGRASPTPTSCSSPSTPPRNPARAWASAWPSPRASRPSSAGASSPATHPTAGRSSSSCCRAAAGTPRPQSEGHEREDQGRDHRRRGRHARERRAVDAALGLRAGHRSRRRSRR